MNKNEITLTVLKFEMWFTKRTKDLVKNHWFSCPNDIWAHPDFEELTAEEWKWFFYLVSVCSKIKNGTITIKMGTSIRVGKLEGSAFETMMEKLKTNQINEGICPQHKPTASRPDADRSTASTDKTDSTLQDNTDSSLDENPKFSNLDSATAELFGEISKQPELKDVLMSIRPHTLKAWLKYDQKWLIESLVYAVSVILDSAKLQNASDYTKWDSALTKWFKIEKKPRYSEVYANTQEFLGHLKPQTAEFEVQP